MRIKSPSVHIAFMIIGAMYFIPNGYDLIDKWFDVRKVFLSNLFYFLFGLMVFSVHWFFLRKLRRETSQLKNNE